ncbi:MAG: response regulator [Spirochaetes bacterium]|nr:response regulator [Spirochaetota bacterium]
MIKHRIMLVEDELITALDIQRMLEKVGYSVTATISSGEEAVERVSQINPDLIIMDIFLSDDMDGIEATALIERKVDIPVIFLTANADTTTIKRADKLKHYGYLLKPIKQGDLNSIISTALQRHEIETNAKNSIRH